LLSKKPYPEVAAHRGAMLLAPQNTIPAYEKARELGADMIEIDARCTADGEVVVVHNSTVDGFTNGSGKVTELTLSDIKGLDASIGFGDEFRGSRIPTLREALEFVAEFGMEVNVEIKDAPLEEVIREVEEAGLEELAMISSPNWQLLKRSKEISPGIATMAMGLRPGDVESVVDELGPDAVNFNRFTLNRESYEPALRAGVLIYQSILGEYDNQAGISRAVGLGAHILETDHPGETLEFLLRKGLRQR